MLVVHENRGLNPYIEDVARRLGVEGYMAFAPDSLSTVGGYPGDEEKAVKLFGTLFCFGGGVANMLAVWMGSDLNAAVPFYGVQPTAEETAKIKAPLLLHYASLDTRITSGWPAFEQALKANHVTYTGYVYEGANHGFHNDTTPRYDEAAAKLAWQRTLDFFNQYLRS